MSDTSFCAETQVRLFLNEKLSDIFLCRILCDIGCTVPPIANKRELLNVLFRICYVKGVNLVSTIKFQVPTIVIALNTQNPKTVLTNDSKKILEAVHNSSFKEMLWLQSQATLLKICDMCAIPERMCESQNRMMLIELLLLRLLGDGLGSAIFDFQKNYQIDIFKAFGFDIDTEDWNCRECGDAIIGELWDHPRKTSLLHPEDEEFYKRVSRLQQDIEKLTREKSHLEKQLQTFTTFTETLPIPPSEKPNQDWNYYAKLTYTSKAAKLCHSLLYETAKVAEYDQMHVTEAVANICCDLDDTFKCHEDVPRLVENAIEQFLNSTSATNKPLTHLQTFEIPNTDPRAALRGQLGLMPTKKIFKNTVIGIYTGDLQTEEELALSKAHYSIRRLEIYRYSFTIEMEPFNDHKFFIDASENGCCLRYINDPHIDPHHNYNDTPESVVAPPNVAFVTVRWGRYPYIIAYAKASINAGQELLANYGQGYWEGMAEHEQHHRGIKRLREELLQDN